MFVYMKCFSVEAFKKKSFKFTFFVFSDKNYVSMWKCYCDCGENI